MAPLLPYNNKTDTNIAKLGITIPAPAGAGLNSDNKS
jgi:hypothetical protein